MWAGVVCGVLRGSASRRGRSAYAKIHEILRDIEHEWTAELGAKRFAELKGLLLRIWESPLVR